MNRYIKTASIAIMGLLLPALWQSGDGYSVATAQSDDYNPTLPAEPGQMAVLSVSVSPAEAGTASGGGTGNIGSSRRITTSRSSAAWVFAGWYDNANKLVSTSSSYYYTLKEGVNRLTARYMQQETATVNVSAYPEEGGTVSGGGLVGVGESASISASARTNFTFSHWEKDGAVYSTNRSISISPAVKGEMNLVAHFEYNPTSTPKEPGTPVLVHTLTVGCDPVEGGSTNYTTTTVTQGTDVTLRATSKANYVFRNWEIDGKVVSENATYVLHIGSRDIKAVAHFEYSPGTPAEPEAARQETYAVYGSSITTSPGLTDVMPIYLENTAEIDKLTFTMRLPKGLNVTIDNKLLDERSQNGTITGTQRKVENDSTEVTITVSRNTPFDGNNGSVMLLMITADDDMAYGTYNVTMKSATAYLNGKQRTVSMRGGQVTLEKPKPTSKLGDVNNDGYVNSQDIWSLARYIVKLPVSNFNMQNADINKNGRIDVIDTIVITILVIKNS